jgi:hypothetical protein
MDVTGVRYNNFSNKWMVRIYKQDGVRVTVGYYSDWDEAVKARRHAEATIGYKEQDREEPRGETRQTVQ